MTTRPVVVLGGTGFIGGHLVERLAREGHRVRAASRRGIWPWETPPASVEMTRLDLACGDCHEALDALLADSSLIFNVTGALQRPGTPDRLYEDLHVQGTLRLLASLGRRPRSGETPRLVHVSTTGVLGPTGPVPLGEDAPQNPDTIYERTKAEGERRALAARTDHLQVVVARPGLVYGERDLHLLGLFRAIASGTFRLIAGGRACWQPVAVEDVVDGLVRMAVAPGVDGEVFHLAGDRSVSLAEFTGAIAAALGTRLRGPSLPRPLAWVAGALLEAGCLPLGIAPPLSRMRVATLTADRRYAIGHAGRRLGWSPEVTLEAGLSAATAWYRARGLLQEAA
jgi:dihydroflavonol-4-reductase